MDKNIYDELLLICLKKQNILELISFLEKVDDLDILLQYNKYYILVELMKKYLSYNCPKLNKILCILIDNSFNINLNIKNSVNNTFIHLLILNHNLDKDKIELIKTILDNGGNINIKNNSGKTPIFYLNKIKYLNNNIEFKKLMYYYSIKEELNYVYNYDKSLLYLSYLSLSTLDFKHININNISNNIYDKCYNYKLIKN